MKTALTILLLVAATSALPFQLNRLLSDLPQKTNTLDGSDSAMETNGAADQSAFDGSSYTNQPLPAAIARNEPQELAFAGADRTASFGALLTDQESSAGRSAVVKQEKTPKPVREPFAKQFSNDQQPPYGAAFDTQGSGSPAPSFGVSPDGQQGGDQQQAASGVPSSSQSGGNQPSGFDVPSGDQFRGNQQPAFEASSPSQQSNFGAPSDSQFTNNQQPAFGASSTSQFGDNQQSGFGADFGDQFGGSEPSAFGSSPNLQSGGSQQADFGVSENSQFGAGQQSGPGPTPETQFGANQQPGFGSNFAGGQPIAAVGSSGPFNVALGDEYFIRTALPFAGYRPTKYTSLDVTQVDFQNALRNSGHQEYISVPGDDASDEAEVYRLVGVAPASAVRGGAATTYSANIGASVPVYRELDDVFEERLMMEAFGVTNPQASVYSAMGGSQQPVRVKAEATLSGGNFAVLLDD